MVNSANKRESKELNERQGLVVKAVVDSYVDEKIPVASNKVKDVIQLDISSSTIRNDMNLLERAGYLAHTHTSSGRVPTDLGYRYFVDNYVIDKIEKSKSKPIEINANDFENVVLVLSSLTNYTAVLVNNFTNSSVILDTHISKLNENTLVLAIFFDDSNIARVVVDIGDVKIQEKNSIDDINLLVRSLFIGSSTSQISDMSTHDIDPTYKKVIEKIIDQVKLENSKIDDDVQVHVAGFANVAKIADQQEISEQLLSLLEQHMKLAEIMKANIENKTNVKIGEENKVNELANFSLAFSPFSSTNGVSGVLGVIGPTRMDYAKVLLCLQAVSETMENK